MQKMGGFTLLELLVTLAIVGLLVAKGIPSFLEYTNNNKVRRVADEMFAGMMMAKAEAIRNNASVVFIPQTTGWRIELVGEGGADNQVISTRAAEGSESNVTVANSTANIVFNGSGRTTSGAQFQMNLSMPSQSACQDAGGKVRCLRIRVTPAGSIKSCDPAVASSDPRAC